MYICKYCLYSSDKEHTLIAHDDAGSKHADVTAEYLAEPLDIVRFKNSGHTLEKTFVISADFKNQLESLDDDASNSTNTYLVGLLA